MVAARARPTWQRWRCDLTDEASQRHRTRRALRDLDRSATIDLGAGHHSLELRGSIDGEGIVASARAQARLDGHAGVVAVHRALLTPGGDGLVRLGWAGTTLADVIARRQVEQPVPDRAASGVPVGSGGEVAAPTSARSLPHRDLMLIGASVAATLDDAHRLHPPLVHGAIDATSIRLDRWGRARLDGFEARCADREAPMPADDIRCLLVMLGRALGLASLGAVPAGAAWRRTRGRLRSSPPGGPAPALISTLLASLTGRRSDAIEAGDLGRALQATGGRLMAAPALPEQQMPPSRPVVLRAGKRRCSTTTTSTTGRTDDPGEATGTAEPSEATGAADSDEATGAADSDEATGINDPGGAVGDRAELEAAAPLPDGLRPIAPIGRGGHGEVWLANDPLLARHVVVKCFRPDDDPTDERYPVAMVRELAALTALAGHPAAVECYGSVVGKRPALVLSWCSEGPLDPGRRWAPTELALLGAEVADALAVLHGRGLVHGDVKPHNLLRDRWGAVRLVDFSLTSPGGAPSPHECSPRHAPPEQLDGGPLSPGVDLAALAATLFHLAEGRPPLDRGDGTDALVARRRSGEREPPPDSLRALPGLSQWVLAWLEPDPHRRPSGGATVAAATLRGVYRPAQDAAPALPRPEPRIRPHRARRVATAVATGLIAIAALGMLVVGNSHQGVPRSDQGDRPAGEHPGRTEASPDGVSAGEAAEQLTPVDPLGAEAPANLRLERGAGHTLALIRTDVSDHPNLSWVIRRDDFERTGGIANDQPSASGLVGRDGTIDDPGGVVRTGAQRSAVLADGDGASCVRVVTSGWPPEVSAPLCWG